MMKDSIINRKIEFEDPSEMPIAFSDSCYKDATLTKEASLTACGGGGGGGGPAF